MYGRHERCRLPEAATGRSACGRVAGRILRHHHHHRQEVRTSRKQSHSQPRWANTTESREESGMSPCANEWRRSTARLRNRSIAHMRKPCQVWLHGWYRSTYLCKPTKNYHGRGDPFLRVPNGHGSRSTLLVRHVVTGTTLHDLLLSRRIGLHTAVMRSVDPPYHRKEHKPCRGEDVISEEEVCKVE